MNRMRNPTTVAVIVALAVMAGSASAAATDGESEPTSPPLGPPVTYEDLAGDVEDGVPDAPGMDAHGPWDHSYEGYIFEGTLPPLRDPVEPVSTEGRQTFPYPTEPPAE